MTHVTIEHLLDKRVEIQPFGAVFDYCAGRIDFLVVLTYDNAFFEIQREDAMVRTRIFA
jgi:hypothetical protein